MVVVSHNFQQGDKNDSVMLLQRALRECMKTALVIDGHFGNATTGCLKDFQATIGVDADGLYRGQTKEVVDQYISKRFIQQWCYGYVAKQVGRSEREFTAIAKAIASVESRSSGFNADGSVTILFERHKFYSELLKHLKNDPKSVEHVAAAIGVSPKGLTANSLIELVSQKNPDICNKSAGGYKGGQAEHARINKACDIHPIAGIAAASYGLYQLMGFNATLCGFKDPNDMHSFMVTSEINHLLAFARFLEATPAIYTHLAKKNYAGIAKLYNGSAYEKNQYDTKLAKALAPFGF